MLDMEGDDPTWWNGVQRNASGAVPEGKLTFLCRTVGQSLKINLDTQCPVP